MKVNVPTVSSKCKWDEPQCVEVTRVEGGFEVRDTKEKDFEIPNVLRFTNDEWDAFTAGVKAGEFDAAERV